MSNTKRPEKFVLSVAQVGGVDVEDSRGAVVDRLINMMREARARDSDFVVFPELALTTFFPRYWMPLDVVEERYFERSMPNADVQPLFDEAQRLGVGFYLGYAELTSDGHRFNTSVLVDKSARILGKYRKIHLPGHEDHKPDAPFQHLEKKYFDAGKETWRVWNLEGVRTGMCLCNDRRWPETWRVMGLQSAELVVLGFNTPSHNIHWQEPGHLRMQSHLLSMQAGAYQNSVWAAAAAKSGVEDGHHLIGGSVIVSPAGEIVAQTASEGDEVITFAVDLAMGENFRKHIFDFGRHRRPEHYRLIIDRVAAGESLVAW